MELARIHRVSSAITIAFACKLGSPNALVIEFVKSETQSKNRILLLLRLLHLHLHRIGIACWKAWKIFEQPAVVLLQYKLECVDHLMEVLKRQLNHFSFLSPPPLTASSSGAILHLAHDFSKSGFDPRIIFPRVLQAHQNLEDGGDTLTNEENDDELGIASFTDDDDDEDDFTDSAYPNLTMQWK
ncbi:hypothetical protein L1987_61110 [Smallanthus sonchifolius]|uniref:Uncharacterized protein n=1 Tax=Smallanthus sonchifolius TaxID=185202 RepID=A0ACB9DA56_9ASTR|nr:hypothetical protein L1987_61110 [Smallanthus sonchifolius]